MLTNKQLQAKISIGIMKLMEYLLPLIISIIIWHYWPIKVANINSDFYSIVIGTVSLLAGYGFTAGFLLLALPRNNNYLKHIDNKGLLFSYALIMFLTSFYAALAILCQLLLQQEIFNKFIMLNINILLFISTIIQFMYSFLILLRVLYLTRKSN